MTVGGGPTGKSDAVAPVLIQVLGPFRVAVGGEPTPVAPREAGILAVLAVAGTGGASPEDLARAVWGDDQPRPVRQSLHNHVTRLRTKLHPRWVELVNGCYHLVPEVVTVDADLVTEAVRAGEELLLDGRPDQALQLVDAALGRWRGRPFDEFDDLPRITEVRALLEQTVAALSDLRTDALVASGRTATAIVELYERVGRDPAREGAWIQLIGLLQQTGRRGDAVAAYHDAREAVRDHLGLEPSEALHAAVDDVLFESNEGELECGAAGALNDAVRAVLAGTPAPARVLELVDAGRRFVLLVGDAGTDVSSMAEVAAERLASTGRGVVLRAHCTANPGSALQPLREIAVLLRERGLIGGGSEGDIDDELPGLAQLVTRPRTGSLAHLVDHVVEDLVRVSERVGGIVLMIDEAQRAGPTTRSVLARLAASGGPVVVIGAWNGEDPIDRDQDDPTFAGMDTIQVPPLTQDETRSLILGLVGARAVTDHLVDRVHAHTAGSPLFIVELVADLRRRGALRREPDGTAVAVGGIDHQLRQVPRTVSHLVRRRLAALDDKAAHVLEVVAALGDETPWALLTDLVDQESAERAVASGLLDRDAAGSSDQVRFRRPLFGAVVRESMPRGRVLEFNHAAASAAAERGLEASIIAWHRVAATDLSPSGVVRAAWDAGTAAMDEQAFAEAAAWFRLAGESLVRDGDAVETAAGPRPRELVSMELQLLRANALRLSGDPAHTALLLDAAQAALESGDRGLQRLAAQMVTPLGGTSEAGRLPRRALAIVEQVLAREEDPAARAQIASSASLLMSMAGEAERCRSLYAEADRISAALGHPEIRASVLPYAYLALGHPTELDAREAAARELLAIAADHADDVAAYEAHHLLFSTAIQRADGDTVRMAHSAMTGLLDRVSDAGRRWAWHYQEAALAHLEGRLSDAARASEKALKVGHGLAVSRAEAAHAGQLLDITRASGGLSELLDTLADLVVQQPTVHAWHAAYALAVAETAELVTQPSGENAAAVVARHVDLVLEPPAGSARHRDFLEVPALFIAGRAAARMGLVDHSRRLHAALAPYSGLMVWQGTCSYGPVDLVLGYLAAALGRQADAVASVRAAVAQSRSLGAPLFAAECEALLAVLRGS